MCSICGSYPHDSRCPNYSPAISYERCALCGDAIEIGEEYIESYNGNLAHVECCSLYGIVDMLKFLDIKIETMEESC